MQIILNQLVVQGNYFFVDLSFINKSNIGFDIDQLRFKIEDKKIVKATNYQTLEIEPIFKLFESNQFNKKHRNIFVFKKFTFPNEKHFSLELSEKLISGRTIKLEIPYQKVLKADNF